MAHGLELFSSGFKLGLGLFLVRSFLGVCAASLNPDPRTPKPHPADRSPTLKQRTPLWSPGLLRGAFTPLILGSPPLALFVRIPSLSLCQGHTFFFSEVGLDALCDPTKKKGSEGS